MDLAELRSLVQRGLLLRAMEGARLLAADLDQPTADRMDALLLACRCAAWRELHANAHGFAVQAMELAEKMGDAERVALARMYTGCALLRAGAPGDAEEHLLAFLEAVEQKQFWPQHRAAALYNLALAYERQRRQEAAAALYSQSAVLHESAGHVPDALNARHNAAWLLLRLDQTEQAATHLDHAAALLSAAQPHQRADHLALQAVRLHQIGRSSDAMDLVEEVLTPPGTPGANAWTRTCAAWLSATIAAREVRPDLARAMLGLALQYAPECQDPALMNLVTTLRSSIGVEG